MHPINDFLWGEVAKLVSERSALIPERVTASSFPFLVYVFFSPMLCTSIVPHQVWVHEFVKYSFNSSFLNNRCMAWLYCNAAKSGRWMFPVSSLQRQSRKRALPFIIYIEHEPFRKSRVRSNLSSQTFLGISVDNSQSRCVWTTRPSLQNTGTSRASEKSVVQAMEISLQT